MPSSARCQVPGCRANLARLAQFYQRYRCCEKHSRAEHVELSFGAARFCQLCGRFQALCDFDDKRRSCRERLAKHNARRKAKQEADAECDDAYCCHGDAEASAPVSARVKTASCRKDASNDDADAASTDSDASCHEASTPMAVLDNETLARELCLHHLVLPSAGSKRSLSTSTATGCTTTSSDLSPCEPPCKKPSRAMASSPKSESLLACNSTNSTACGTASMLTGTNMAAPASSPFECFSLQHPTTTTHGISTFANTAQQAAWVSFLTCLPPSSSASAACPPPRGASPSPTPASPHHNHTTTVPWYQEPQATMDFSMDFDRNHAAYEQFDRHFKHAFQAPMHQWAQETHVSPGLPEPEIMALWNEWSGAGDVARDCKYPSYPSTHNHVVLDLAAPAHRQMHLCAF